MHQLTDRQRDIAALMLAGACRRQISARLGITRITLGQHLADMRQRLDCPNDAALTARLRHMNRNPADAMLEVCRVKPRRWMDV